MKHRVTNIKALWLPRTCRPFSANWDLLPNNKIECAFLLLIIFLSSPSLSFICDAAGFFLSCRCTLNIYVCACLIVLVLTSADVAEGRYIKGDPLKGYYDFIITGKPLCIFLLGVISMFPFYFKKIKIKTWKEDCDKFRANKSCARTLNT